MTQDKVEYRMNMFRTGDILVHRSDCENCCPQLWPDGEGKPNPDWRGPYATFGAAVVDAEALDPTREVRRCGQACCGVK